MEAALAAGHGRRPRLRLGRGRPALRAHRRRRSRLPELRRRPLHRRALLLNELRTIDSRYAAPCTSANRLRPTRHSARAPRPFVRCGLFTPARPRDNIADSLRRGARCMRYRKLITTRPSRAGELTSSWLVAQSKERDPLPRSSIAARERAQPTYRLRTSAVPPKGWPCRVTGGRVHPSSGRPRPNVDRVEPGRGRSKASPPPPSGAASR
jgi:hypothetical protein